MSKDAAVWSPAGFWIRFVAIVIDSFVINIATAPIAAKYASYFEAHSFRVSGIYLVIWGTYGALCNLWMQGTIGKKILNLKLVDASTGERVAFGVVFFRDSIGRLIDCLTFGIGFLLVAFNSEKKALHDHIFATRVVKKVPVAVYGDDAAKG